jgi:hypothetical protein
MADASPNLMDFGKPTAFSYILTAVCVKCPAQGCKQRDWLQCYQRRKATQLNWFWFMYRQLSPVSGRVLQEKSHHPMHSAKSVLYMVELDCKIWTLVTWCLLPVHPFPLTRLCSGKSEYLSSLKNLFLCRNAFTGFSLILDSVKFYKFAQLWMVYRKIWCDINGVRKS